MGDDADMESFFTQEIEDVDMGPLFTLSQERSESERDTSGMYFIWSLVKGQLKKLFTSRVESESVYKGSSQSTSTPVDPTTPEEFLLSFVKLHHHFGKEDIQVTC